MQPGEMAFLTGHSGAGKSTLLKLICGIERPSAGKIWFSGHDDKRGVPVNTILVSALVTALCVLINYLAPESAFGLLMALVVSALVINWAMISLAHMKFRRAKQEQGVVTHFPALLYPLGNWICLLFMAAVLAKLAYTCVLFVTPCCAVLLKVLRSSA